MKGRIQKALESTGISEAGSFRMTKLVLEARASFISVSSNRLAPNLYSMV